MAKEVRLPQLGQTMEEGTIVECRVKVGDEIKKGDIIFDIETDKATLEMESPADGFVKHILANVGQTLPVGELLMVLGGEDEEVSQSFIDSLKGGGILRTEDRGQKTENHPNISGLAPTPVAVGDERRKVMASPRAKKLAEELGVDLATVTGTGPAGKITEEDVKSAAEAEKRLAPGFTPGVQEEIKLGATIPLNRIQKITAERMLKSKREIPCFYLTAKADVTDLVTLRADMNKTGDLKVSYNDFIMKAAATGLEKYPIMTGQLAGEAIKLADAIHIGLAISVPGGLVAPIVKDVNKKDIKQIARDSQVLIEKARGNKLAPADLEGGCITVSNLGAFGIDNFIPIVVPGQCSILGIGRITDTCVPAPASHDASRGSGPDNGKIKVRKLMNMTLSVDHKVTNGAYAAQFLDYVRKLLEDTATLGNW
jgi:pyruvate dehydrogenase E2 component (dihydrolipoamide acetyltransferase)